MSKIVRVPAGNGQSFSIAGAQWTWKVRSQDTDGVFCFFEQTLQPGQGVPLHVHSYAEAFYVLDGELLFESNDNQDTIQCRRGDTVLARPGVMHTFRNTGSAEARILSISTAKHQAFFDAVAAADRELPFAAMPPADAFARVAEIGDATDTRFIVSAPGGEA